MKSKKIYLASSWRNPYQPAYVDMLRDWGYQVYDFRNPKGDTGFSWSKISDDWEQWTTHEYLLALENPVSVAGFDSDWAAMKWADTCVMLLPCGMSAGIEFGWSTGADKKTIVHFPEQKTNPDLMVKMATNLTDSMVGLYKALAR